MSPFPSPGRLHFLHITPVLPPSFWLVAIYGFCCPLSPAMNEASARLIAAALPTNSTATLAVDAIRDTCLYLSDCALSLLALLRVYPEAAAVCWQHGLLQVRSRTRTH